MHCSPVGHGFKVGKHPGSQNCGLCSLFLKVRSTYLGILFFKVTYISKVSLPPSILHSTYTHGFLGNVEMIQEDSLDLIPSPLHSVKMQIIGRKVYLR